MKRVFQLLSIAFGGVFLTACDLEKDIDLNLPGFKSELAVECYLEAGQPYRLTLFESTRYTDQLEPVLVTDAQVIITHNGRPDTLQFQPTYDPETGKLYTHVSATVVSGAPGESYALDVADRRGRHLTGTTRFLPLVKMDSVQWKLNNENKYLVRTIFQDDPAQDNYYRWVLHRDTLSSRKVQYDRFTNDRLNNGKKIEFGTRNRFDPNDTLFVTLYHIEKPYYDFLNTLSDAYSANGNPFAQPSTITSTVKGGIGVFTTLVYERRQIVLK